METVNNMANAAVAAVWGESNQNGPEPISGQRGDTSKGEPYDAGNIGKYLPLYCFIHLPTYLNTDIACLLNRRSCSSSCQGRDKWGDKWGTRRYQSC